MGRVIRVTGGVPIMTPSTPPSPDVVALERGSTTMPEIINSLFGRSKNATASSAEEGEPTMTATLEPTGDTFATEDVTEDVAEDVEAAPSADDVVESVEDESTDRSPADAENSDDDAEAVDVEEEVDEDEPVADEAADETDVEEADVEEADEAATDDEVATDEDTAEEAAAEVADEDGGSAEDVEPVAAEADDAPVAAETAETAETADADADADDVEETEPVVVPVVVPAAAEARPAAGARGNVTVGEGVVAKVVNIVVGKIDGVHSLDDEGTSIEVADDIATVKVSLVVEYGHAIKALAEQIRVDVIEAVEQFLGLDVASVDVHVSDIHFA
jgi:uncharacterized alkaline shock family protein YloU